MQRRSSMSVQNSRPIRRLRRRGKRCELLFTVASWHGNYFIWRQMCVVEEAFCDMLCFFKNHSWALRLTVLDAKTYYVNSPYKKSCELWKSNSWSIRANKICLSILTSTTQQPMVWVWRRGYLFLQPIEDKWVLRKPVWKQSLFLQFCSETIVAQKRPTLCLNTKNSTIINMEIFLSSESN